MLSHRISRRIAALAGTVAVSGALMGTLTATESQAAIIPPLQPVGTALYYGTGQVLTVLVPLTGNLISGNPTLNSVGVFVDFDVL